MLFGEGIRNSRSTAHKMALFSGRTVDISFMYIRNNKGPSTEPWGYSVFNSCLLRLRKHKIVQNILIILPSLMFETIL